MKRIVAVLVIGLVILPAVSSFGIPVPPEVKKVIAFIFVPGKDGNLIPQGTAFLIGVKHPQKPDESFAYLVTAKHVLLTNDKKSWLPAVFVRLNKKDGSSDMLRFDLIFEGPKKNVFTHEDSTVDLAVIPAVPDQQKYDFRFLPEEMITTKEDYLKLNIREGSDVFFTGLFIPHVAQRNYPIVRFGKVALVSDERIEFGGVEAELYLMKANAYSGNSGSPVFFYFGAEREPGTLTLGQPVLKLAGVISGRFNDVLPVQVVQTDAVPIVTPSLGIAGVVPAYKLHDILFGEDLKKQRGASTK